MFKYFVTYHLLSGKLNVINNFSAEYQRETFYCFLKKKTADDRRAQSMQAVRLWTTSFQKYGKRKPSNFSVTGTTYLHNDIHIVLNLIIKHNMK